MASKKLVFACMMIGSFVGGYIPVLWGADTLSVSSVLLSGLGGLLGIWFAIKISR